MEEYMTGDESQTMVQEQNAEIISSLSHLRTELTSVATQMAVLSSQTTTLSAAVGNHANLAERLTKLETRTEARMEIAEQQSSVNRWLIGTLAAIMTAILSIAASHINWR
jgi:hypothetical protein